MNPSCVLCILYYQWLYYILERERERERESESESAGIKFKKKTGLYYYHIIPDLRVYSVFQLSTLPHHLANSDLFQFAFF